MHLQTIREGTRSIRREARGGTMAAGVYILRHYDRFTIRLWMTDKYTF
jgi:hypothetical protein